MTVRNANNQIKTTCLFCQIACGEKQTKLFAEFEKCYVIKDEFPVSNGHLLIIPHDHVRDWFEASEEVQIEILKTLQLMKVKLMEECSPDGFNIGMNCGAAAGQSIMHLHVHLIPRYLGDVENPRGGVRGVIPAKQNY